jgi:hypothetical protein
MHELRSAILTGQAARAPQPASTKEICRRRRGSADSLMGISIPREERRVTNQRREDRHLGLVDRAMIVFRRKRSLVKVVNISASGMMIETDIIPHINEELLVEFEGFAPLCAVVRWVKQGRIGLDIGDGGIALT